MIVISEITTALKRADTSYIELQIRYINQAKKGNAVYSLFTKLNIIKACRKSLQAFNLAKPQITEPEFNYIIDIINGIYFQLFSINSQRSTICLTSKDMALDNDPNTCDDTSIDWEYYCFQATSIDQTVFPNLPFSISSVDPEALRFTVNGETKLYGETKDYHIIGKTLYWHDATLYLDPDDHLTIAYYLL